MYMYMCENVGSTWYMLRIFVGHILYMDPTQSIEYPMFRHPTQILSYDTVTHVYTHTVYVNKQQLYH